jgi:hypothetical protein
MDKDKIKSVVLGAGCGAIAITIIGFSWGGWVTGSKASVLIENSASDAVVERLSPICVAQFQQDPEKVQKVIKFKKIETWNRSDFVGEQGWATMLGEKDPDSLVSRKCAELITVLTG